MERRVGPSFEPRLCLADECPVDGRSVAMRREICVHQIDGGGRDQCNAKNGRKSDVKSLQNKSHKEGNPIEKRGILEDRPTPDPTALIKAGEILFSTLNLSVEVKSRFI